MDGFKFHDPMNNWNDMGLGPGNMSSRISKVEDTLSKLQSELSDIQSSF